jgi:bicarbonate transport system permease protein
LTPLVTLFILLALWEFFSLFNKSLPGPIRVVRDTWTLILYPFYVRSGCGNYGWGHHWSKQACLQRT